MVGSRRSYSQYCSLAAALDVLGERWTLLIVRELFAGPLRFTDLQRNLSGLGTGLLAARLRELQEAGVVETVELPAPARQAYQLTAGGGELDQAVTALGRWGTRRLPALEGSARRRPLWLLQSLAAGAPPLADAADATIAVHLDGERHHLLIRRGRLVARRGDHPEPDAHLHAGFDTLLGVVKGELTVDDAIAAGGLRIEGDDRAVRHALERLALEGLATA